MPAHNPTFWSAGFRNITPTMDRALRAADDWADHLDACWSCTCGRKCEAGKELHRVYMQKRKNGLDQLRKLGVI